MTAQPDENPQITVRRAAMNLLARREQSFQELVKKLGQKYPDLDIDECILPALEKLRQEKLQSDARFVEAYVRYRRTRGMGPLKIIAELGQKGVAELLIRQAVYSQAIDWQAQCREALSRKFPVGPDGDQGDYGGRGDCGDWEEKSDSRSKSSNKDREKRYRFLSQRGFEGEQIWSVLGDS